MRPINCESEESPIKRWFDQSPGPGLRAFTWLLISLFLLIIDHGSVSFHKMRTVVASSIAYPFEWAVDAPVRFARWVGESVTSQQHLVDENAKLRAKTLLLQSRLQRLMKLQKENAQLRLLLQSSLQVSGRVQVARLLAVSLTEDLLQIIVDKGTNDQVYVGQPVLDAHGVMGQVVSAGPLTSKVLLITDPRSAVPVKDERNGVRAIVQGSGLSGELSLIHVPNSGDIQKNDVFVTSGLGLRYPMGYPVGKVISVEHGPANEYQHVTLTPCAHLDQSEQVLLAWPSKSALFSVVQKQLQSGLPTLKSVKNHEARK